MRPFFYKILSNLLRCFKGRNLIWHFLAMALTFFIVTSGLDWFYFQSSGIFRLRALIFPAIILGGLLPVILPFIILALGKIKKSLKTINTAYALGQAALLGLVISDFYKALTGRTHPPELFTPSATIDTSQVFKFGFLQNGVFWGWPSTHTAIAFAMAVALFMLYPKNKIIKYAAILYAFYIGLGVSVSIHWFSDFVAGAIIGTVIGVAVGQSFCNRPKEV